MFLDGVLGDVESLLYLPGRERRAHHELDYLHFPRAQAIGSVCSQSPPNSSNPAGSMTMTISPWLLRCCDSLLEACGDNHRPDLARTDARNHCSISLRLRFLVRRNAPTADHITSEETVAFQPTRTEVSPESLSHLSAAAVWCNTQPRWPRDQYPRGCVAVVLGRGQADTAALRPAPGAERFDA